LKKHGLQGNAFHLVFVQKKDNYKDVWTKQWGTCSLNLVENTKSLLSSLKPWKILHFVTPNEKL